MGAVVVCEAALSYTAGNLVLNSDDEVHSLPGWSGALPSRHFSGYLPVGAASGVPGHIHYWLVLSERAPASDPLVYWTNGGPGGSGISTGLLTELGQLQLNQNSLPANGSRLRSPPTLFYNQFNWARTANTLFVSQPKGVGFSHCDGAASPCINTDLSAAQDAVDFFHAFYAKCTRAPSFMT